MIYWLTTIKSQIARKTFKQNLKKKKTIFVAAMKKMVKKFLWVATMKKKKSPKRIYFIFIQNNKLWSVTMALYSCHRRRY